MGWLSHHPREETITTWTWVLGVDGVRKEQEASWREQQKGIK